MQIVREASGARVQEANVIGCSTTVAVIIPTFNHARFLGEAITSVLAQTRPADQIIVVDDGSTDDPGSILKQFPDVKLVRRNNGGPSAARNTGLRICTADYVAFLDADDRLLPTALESELACISARSEYAFVYGGHRYISEGGEPIGPDCFKPIEGGPHLALLHANQIIMHATVLYRRLCLLAVNGFDETLRRVEDFDIYLRIAQRYAIACYPVTVVEYRKHGQSLSSNQLEMLISALGVLARHKVRIHINRATRLAFREGRTALRIHYGSKMLAAAHARWAENRNTGALVGAYIQTVRWSPFITLRTLLGRIGRRASKVLPVTVVRWMEWVRGRPYSRD